MKTNHRNINLFKLKTSFTLLLINQFLGRLVYLKSLFSRKITHIFSWLNEQIRYLHVLTAKLRFSFPVQLFNRFAEISKIILITIRDNEISSGFTLSFQLSLKQSAKQVKCWWTKRSLKLLCYIITLKQYLVIAVKLIKISL